MRYVNTYGQAQDLSTIAPDEQASNISLSSATELGFDRGNGEKFLAVLSTSEIAFLPFNNVTYVVGQTLGLGAYVIKKGIEALIDVSSLSPGTYFIRIFEYNGLNGSEQYNRSTAALNPTSFVIGEGGSFDFTFDDTFE